MTNTILNIDAIEGMELISDKSIDINCPRLCSLRLLRSEGLSLSSSENDFLNLLPL